MLRKRMNERGLLVKDGNRETLMVRRVLEGRQRNVLQLIPAVLTPQPSYKIYTPGSGMDTQGPKCQECQVPAEVDRHDPGDEIEERAAIMEIDGNLPRDQAVAKAQEWAQHKT